MYYFYNIYIYELFQWGCLSTYMFMLQCTRSLCIHNITLSILCIYIYVYEYEYVYEERDRDRPDLITLNGGMDRWIHMCMQTIRLN